MNPILGEREREEEEEEEEESMINSTTTTKERKNSETCRKYIGQNKNFEKFSTNFGSFQESKASIKACWQKFW